MARERVLVADDEPTIRLTIGEHLQSLGYEVEQAASCAQVLERFGAGRVDAAVLDHAMPGGSSVELLPRLRQLAPEAAIVILTGRGSIALAVEAIQAGADQFLTKPVELAALGLVVERLLAGRRAGRRGLAESRREARQAPDPFVGTSPAIRALAEQARRLAAADSPVLLEGETGTGKGLLAAWLHAHGPRAGEAFVDLNCAGLSPELLASELFGHERGAFTGAAVAKPGLLEVADRGTVFLDEIGDMDLQVQATLLKVVEEQRFRRLGDVRDRQVDVRLVAATHVDLKARVAQRAFRSDLYFRVSTLPLRVPPLRERREDIPLLAARLIERVGREVSRPRLALEPDALRALQERDWPGNVRELRNVLERAALLCDHDRLGRRDLLLEGAPAVPPADGLSGTLAEIERRAIERALADQGGHAGRAARQLGLARSTFYARLKAHGLAPRP